MNKMYYHFVSSTLRDGSPIPADGEWLSVDGQIELCARGLHASEYVADAVRYAPGTTLCLVELDGEIIKGNDKLCARKRKIIARLDATVLLRKNACESALSVAHLWKMPAIVRQYLETQDESIRVEAHKTADAAAAYAAASAADAADAAAYAAASAAAYAAYAAYAAAAAAYAAAAYAAAAAADAADAADAAAVKQKSKQQSRDRLQAAVDAKFAEILNAQT